MAAQMRPIFCRQAFTSFRNPSTSSIRHSFSHRLSIRQQSLSIASTTSTSTSSNSSPINAPQVTSKQSSDFEPLTYHVHRTPGQQLPIYHLAKAGGNKHQTRIRKISGSVEDLKRDLEQALGLWHKDIVINSVNGHIVIKGWRKFEVAKFLEEKRF